ncbi:MAG: nitric oxide synthase oxygenase [Cyanobium sp.]
MAFPEARQAMARQGLVQAFPAVDPNRLEAILAMLPCRELTAGEVLLRIAEPGNSAFVLLEGRLQVYGRGPAAELVAIACIDTPGRLFGEQALLPGHRHRNADVVALESSLVLELPSERFAELLAADANALPALRRRGLEELRGRLDLLGVGLEAEALDPEGSGSLQLAAGSLLLAAGAIPERAYSIVAGEIDLLAEESDEPLLRLGPGGLVAVLELIEMRPFRHSAVARSPLEVLPIDRNRLLRLLGREESAASLQALVALPGLGRVFRTRTVRDGELVVISEFSDLAGGALRVSQRLGQGRIEATRPLPAETQLLCCQTPDGRNRLLLEPATGHLLGLELDQDWPQLSELMGLLLRDESLSQLQRQAFEANGQLLLETPEQRVEAGSQLVCACTGTSATQLREFARHCSTLAELQRLSAAGTVCGGCRNRLPLFLGQPPQARLCRLRITPLAEGSLAVRLEPIEPEPLPPWQAGEHLLVEALIEGRWIGRSYTLTGGDAGHYELGVKLERGGLLSNWLASAAPNALVRISAPQGQLLPDSSDRRPLLVAVAGIGVTPAIAAVRRLAQSRSITIAYTYRGEAAAAYLEELREAARRGEIRFLEHDSARLGRLTPTAWLESLAPLLESPLEAVICGPEAFNRLWHDELTRFAAVQVRLESFAVSASLREREPGPGSWRLSPDELARRRRVDDERLGSCPPPVPVGVSDPWQEARAFLHCYRREQHPHLDLPARLAEVEAELSARGQWHPSPAELGFGSCLAWRQAERCVGRLYWQGLELFDRRDLHRAEPMAEAIFEHLRYAFNHGDLRPAISVFDPGEPGRPGPRIWNPQLLRYAGYRGPSGRQVGDPAQNALTARIRQLGWQPQGGDFELLPLVIETPEQGPQLFALPPDCRREVTILHPRHPWLEAMGLRWMAVPAVSDMALDLGGNLFRMAPFNGWYLNTEIAARNFSDTNRYNLLPRIAEALGLDLTDERGLWRDHAQLLLAEAVLYSFDQAGVKISDHHTIGHEFLEFCRAEQSQGREPQAEWSWVVPPMAGSLNVLYQEPFSNQAFKPAFLMQAPAWDLSGASTNVALPGGEVSDALDPLVMAPAAQVGRCPFTR